MNMHRLRHVSLLSFTLFIFSFLFFTGKFFAADDPERLYIPFLEPDSQSNVAVTVSSMIRSGETPCPPEFTNSLSNTTLFTREEQKLIGEALIKYRNVTTNSGPPGTVLVNFYKTNFVAPPLDWVKTNAYWMAHRTNEIWVSCFQYTNSEAQEEIRLGTGGGGMSAKFTNKSKDGYTASIARTGGGSLLTVTERKHGSASGLLVRFYDLHGQGMTWDYKLADFSEGRLVEYMRTTNGMFLGRWLTWDASSGGLTLAAECKIPYDWNNHRIKLPQ